MNASSLMIFGLIFSLTAVVVIRPLGVLAAASSSSCPAGYATPGIYGANVVRAPDGYAQALAKIDFAAVKEDLTTLMTDSQDFWPADYNHYGPFFIRLAWHCAGSYRRSDGRGGCDGGRQRFDPERSWDDNTNLDKARRLLEPIKRKYGLGLSWGDLFILSANVAIESMGGPVLGFCAGRIDDSDGSWSEALGPSAEQEANYPCEEQGKCESPLGSSTVGLIYVNPEGVLAVPDPVPSVGAIRDVFGRMGMNDSETVALIGGGHAFGKTHGPCTTGPGDKPNVNPRDPWAGTCGTGAGKGKLENAFTSGFEGPWTSTPTTWNAAYFTNLITHNWEVHEGPGGHQQWRVQGGNAPQAPGVGNNSPPQDIMMLTTDIALINGNDASYEALVREFASDQSALDTAFAHAWYKLTTRDMGPVTRCFGDDVPPAQAWQYPLPPPPPPAALANFNAVRQDLKAALVDFKPDILKPDGDGSSGSGSSSSSSYAPQFVRAAFSCAGTFRQSDYRGGCNGARLRFSPESEWAFNVALDKVIELLEPIKNKHGDGLSWADLLVLAGNVGLEHASSGSDFEIGELPFCGGRTDADDGAGSVDLEPSLTGGTEDTVGTLREYAVLKGLSVREFTALYGGGHSLGQMHADRSGYTGAWTDSPMNFDNDFFINLLAGEWAQTTITNGKIMYTNTNASVTATFMPLDTLFRYEPEAHAAAVDFATNKTAFVSTFASAWTKMMNADRFDGPFGGPCEQPANGTGANVAGLQAAVGVLVALLVLVLAGGLFVFWRKGLLGGRTGSYGEFDNSDEKK